MKTQHTPGPWTDIPAQAAPAGYSYTVLANGNPIADIPDGDNDEANAALIASAPSLLAENQKLREELKEIAGMAEEGRLSVSELVGYRVGLGPSRMIDAAAAVTRGSFISIAAKALALVQGKG